MFKHTLYLLPVWLHEGGKANELPGHNGEIAQDIRLFFCEHERTAPGVLKRMCPAMNVNEVELLRLDKDTPTSTLNAYVQRLQQQDAAVLSDAGMPCIADPGARLVAAAHQHGTRVVALPGPCSFALALAASGLNGQAFTFHGYLPIDGRQRRAALRALEDDMQRTGRTQILMETPHRNKALLEEILHNCRPESRLCMAIDLGSAQEQVYTRTIAQWRNAQAIPPKRPAVFLLGLAAG
jgi:16S rRNA (cytidine1402-2'-O)-methyltransferase